MRVKCALVDWVGGAISGTAWDDGRAEHTGSYAEVAKGRSGDYVKIGFWKAEWKIVQVPTNQGCRCDFRVKGYVTVSYTHLTLPTILRV